MSDNIKVAVRLRSPLPREHGQPIVTQVTSPTSFVIQQHISTSSLLATEEFTQGKIFTFDHCFKYSESASHDQEVIYDTIGREYLLHTLDGYNTCILAYGQTGSGKSFTMMGPEVSKHSQNNDTAPDRAIENSAIGIIPRVCCDLFDICNMCDSEEDGIKTQFEIYCSYLEIYNEQVRDLLSEDGNKCRVRERADKTTFVEGLNEFKVCKVEEILEYMKQGDRLRTVGVTNMNNSSSRSHAIFTISIKQSETTLAGDLTERKSSIKLVDLAGSERVSTTGARGDRLKEGSNINKSLTTLGRVISVLAKKNRPKLIPYRDSALTWVLKENLGGNSKTAMIACVSPCDYEETISTLRYATTAKEVKNTARVNSSESLKNKEQLVAMRNQLEELQKELSLQSAKLKNQELLREQIDKIKCTNAYLEKRIEQEAAFATKYHERWDKIIREKAQLESTLLSVIGAMYSESLSKQDWRNTIDSLLKESHELKSALASDVGYGRSILEKYHL